MAWAEPTTGTNDSEHWDTAVKRQLARPTAPAAPSGAGPAPRGRARVSWRPNDWGAKTEAVWAWRAMRAEVPTTVRTQPCTCSGARLRACYLNETDKTMLTLVVKIFRKQY